MAILQLSCGTGVDPNGAFATQASGCLSGAWQGVKQTGSASGSVLSLSQAIDGSGLIYSAGRTDTGIAGNSLTGTTDLYVTQYDNAGALQWARQLGAAGKASGAYGIATDSAGNAYVAGYTMGGLDGNTLTGVSDAVVAKYDALGNRQWTRQYGVASASTLARGIVVDGDSNIYVTGSTNGALGAQSLSGSTDSFVMKLDSSGSVQWTRLLGVSGAETIAVGVSVSSSRIAVMGFTDGSVAGNTLAGTKDMIVSLYDLSGTRLWTRQLGVATKDTEGNRVVLDSSRNVYVTGSTEGALPGNTLTGTEDLFVAKYSSSGTRSLLIQAGVAGAVTEAWGIGLDASGDLVISGKTEGALGGQPLTGTRDAFVARYDSTGTQRWLKLLGAAGKATSSNNLLLDCSGAILIGGITNGGLAGNSAAGSGNSEFVAKYDSQGTRL